MKILNSFLFMLIAFAFIACDEDNAHDDGNHTEADGMVLKVNNVVYLKLFKGAFDPSYNTSIVIDHGETIDFEMKMLDSDGDEFNPPMDVEFELAFDYVGATKDFVEFFITGNDKYKFSAKGIKPGNGQIRISILHNGHADFITPFINVGAN